MNGSCRSGLVDEWWRPTANQDGASPVRSLIILLLVIGLIANNKQCNIVNNYFTSHCCNYNSRNGNGRMISVLEKFAYHYRTGIVAINTRLALEDHSNRCARSYLLAV